VAASSEQLDGAARLGLDPPARPVLVTPGGAVGEVGEGGDGEDVVLAWWLELPHPAATGANATTSANANFRADTADEATH
jgi:hypothetical protein